MSKKAIIKRLSLVKKIQGYTVQEKHIVTVGSGKFDVNGKMCIRDRTYTNKF